MGGFDQDAYLAKKDTAAFDPDKYLSEEETIVEDTTIPTVTVDEQTDEIKPSGNEVVTEKTEELSLPSPSKYEPRLRLSGKDISLMQKATDAAFSSSDIFTGVNGQRNKDIYYSALLKQGYTPDDISLIKGEKEGFMYGKPDKPVWSGGKTAETSKPQAIQPTHELYDKDFAIQSFGGNKNYSIYKATSELFKNDPFFADNSDNRDAFYSRLKEKGVDEKSLNLIRNNVENELTSKELSEGQGIMAVINPIGASFVMAKDMAKAGHDLVTDKQEFDKLKKVIAEEGIAAGAVVGVKSALDVAMGALALTPPGVAFTVGYNVAHDVAPGVVEFIGTWPSHIGEMVGSAVGKDIKNGPEWHKAYWGILDFMGFAVALGGAHKGGKWTKEKAKEVLDPTLKENRDAQIQDLTKRYGKLTREQKNNAAQEWYNMMAQNKLVPLTEQRTQVKDPGVLAADLYDTANKIEQQKKADYEQAKAEMVKKPESEPAPEPRPDTPEKVQASISDVLPKLKEYVVGFDVTTPLNEVASGLSVKYQGMSGKLGRSETGEITFTDYSNGKTTIITGGDDTTPFADKGLSINEGYYENYYVEGDATGYTVYKIGKDGMKPAFEGDKVNQSRRDAIIRKALGKSPLTIEAEKAADKVAQLNVALQKSQGTPAEPLLVQAIEKARQEAAVKNEEAIVEQHADAMGEVVKAELQEKIEQLEVTAERLNDAGKEAIEPAIAEAKTMLDDLTSKSDVPAEMPQSFGRLKELHESIAKDLKSAIKESDITEFRKDMTRDKMELMLRKMESLGIIKIEC